MAAGGAATMVVVPSGMLSCAPIIYFTLLMTTCLGMDYVPVAPTDTALPLGAPPFEHSAHHPQPPQNVSAKLNTRPARLQTNSFYSNWLVDGPEKMAWTLPYVVSVNKDAPYGLTTSHPRQFEGPTTTDGRLAWYANSAVKDIVFTCVEFTASTQAFLTGVDDIGLGAEIMFTTEGGGSMRSNLVRGMAYVTVTYEGHTTPVLSTTHAILKINGKDATASYHSSTDGVFELEFNDGSTWCLFVGNDETAGSFTFRFVPAEPGRPSRLESVRVLAALTTFRVAKVPYDVVKHERSYKKNLELLRTHSAVFPTGADLKAEVGLEPSSDEGKVTLTWRTSVVPGGGGDSNPTPLLHFALPHHQEKLEASTRTGIFLASPTKGEMELIAGETWIMVEEGLPELSWVPEIDDMGHEQRSWIEHQLEKDVGSVDPETFVGASIYSGGKHLMASAQLCLIADKLDRWDLVDACLDHVAPALDRYISGTNGNPLVYDEVWGGIIGSNGLVPGEESSDFFSAYYNDHHFHYGYLINAAAVLAWLRPSWATPAVKDWVDALIRDVNCPSYADPYFGAFRSFDWFCGHSWARGLLFAYDGKDQESTSEDVNFYYAMAMWGKASGSEDLSNLGRLQLGVLARSISTYFLMTDSNSVHPAAFVRNKVTGILFEMKVDYTTWFGGEIEFIHGIQNIPVTAVTSSIRTPEFAKEEWDQRLAGVIDRAPGTWKTVLLMSYATIEKNLAFLAMLSSGADEGLSRTWALYWAATRPHCEKYCTHEKVTLPTISVSLPFGNGGQPWPIPGVIEAEDFDQGGNGVAYYDVDPENRGDVAYRRAESVDIQERIRPATGHKVNMNVGWIATGEWLQYSTFVAKGGLYSLSFAVASVASTSTGRGYGSFRLLSGGYGCSFFSEDLTGVIVVPPTGGPHNFINLRVANVRLKAGHHRVRLCAIAGGFNFDSFTALLTYPLI